MTRTLSHTVGGRIWRVDVDEFASQEAIEYAQAELIRRAEWETYEKPKVHKKRKEFLALKEKFDLSSKRLVNAAEAIVGYPIPSLALLATAATSDLNSSELPIFTGVEMSIMHQLRRELPKDVVAEYKKAADQLERHARTNQVQE